MLRRSCVALFVPPKLPDVESPTFAPITTFRLYRKLLKFYIKRFNTDYETIVKAWKQTRYEFLSNKGVSKDDAEVLLLRGQQIHHALLCSIVPVYHNEKENRTYAKYDAEMLTVNARHVDPITHEEFIRRYHDKIPKEDLQEYIAKLKTMGRWQGSEELSDKDLVKVKSKRRRVKCTDPEEEDAPAAASASSSGAPQAAAKLDNATEGK